MDELVKNLMAAYRERIESRDWMGPENEEVRAGEAGDRDAKNRLSRRMARLFGP